jgi:hypothetical protein
MIWCRSEDGEIVNLAQIVSIGVNTKITPGEFVVVGVLVHAKSHVVIRRFKLKESAFNYLEEIYETLPQLPRKSKLH